MNTFEDMIDNICDVWISILLFITWPVWGVPYVAYWVLYIIAKKNKRGRRMAHSNYRYWYWQKPLKRSEKSRLRKEKQKEALRG